MGREGLPGGEGGGLPGGEGGGGCLGEGGGGCLGERGGGLPGFSCASFRGAVFIFKQFSKP
jgi:hypothetical protein